MTFSSSPEYSKGRNSSSSPEKRRKNSSSYCFSVDDEPKQSTQDTWTFSSQPDVVQKVKKVGKIQIGATLGVSVDAKSEIAGRSRPRQPSSSSRKRQRDSKHSRSAIQKSVSKTEDKANRKIPSRGASEAASTENIRRASPRKSSPSSRRRSRKNSKGPQSTKPRSSSQKSTKRKHGATDDDFSSDSDMEIPYTQNLGLDEPVSLARQLADFEAEDSDTENKTLKRKREPIRPGDVIAYYNPAFIYGNPLGFRVTQVLATFGPNNTEGRLLDLDNAEILPDDTRVKRIGEYRDGRVVKHPGVYREIKLFRLRSRRLDGNTKTGLARQVERMRQHVEELREAARTMPPKESALCPPPYSSCSEDEKDNEKSPIRASPKPESDDASSSGDSIVQVHLDQSNRVLERFRESRTLLPSSQGSNSNACSDENTPNASSPVSEHKKSEPASKPRMSSKAQKFVPMSSQSKDSSFSLSRAPSSTASKRILLPQDLEAPKDKAKKSTDILGFSDSDDDSDDDLLFQPVFSKKPVQKSIPKSSETAPAVSSKTVSRIHDKVETDTASKPPRTNRSSFGVKEIAQRRARGWSEQSPSLREAEAAALDKSDDDDALSITSSNRQMRHKSLHKKRKKTKHSSESKIFSHDQQGDRPSIFRPTTLERENDHVYGVGVIDSSDEEKMKERSRYRNPLTRCDESISSYAAGTTTSKTKKTNVKSWLHGMHNRSQNARKQHQPVSSRKKPAQAGPMRLSFEKVDHSTDWR